MEEEGAGAKRGKIIHKEAEDYLKGDGVHKFSAPLEKSGPQLVVMREHHFVSEETWFVGRNWERLDEDGPQAMIKGIVDIHKYWSESRVLEISDLKTGKRYPEHRDQLELYALMGMARYPEAERVDVDAMYVDEGGVRANRNSYIPAMASHYQERWTYIIEKIENDQDFLPTPSRSACKWCPFKASKGGPCQAGDLW